MLPWAIGEGKYAEKDMVIVVPVPEGQATPTPTPTPTVAAQVVQNWQLWFSLFVDQASP